MSGFPHLQTIPAISRGTLLADLNAIIRRMRFRRPLWPLRKVLEKYTPGPRVSYTTGALVRIGVLLAPAAQHLRGEFQCSGTYSDLSNCCCTYAVSPRCQELEVKEFEHALWPARSRSWLIAALAIAAASHLSACYHMRSSAGGGQTEFTPPRKAVAADIAVPQGYTVELVATGLTFPTGVTFDAQGRVHVVEAGYSYGEVWTTPRLVRIDAGGTLTAIASGGKNGPWTGVAFNDGAFIVAEGGELEGGRILKITPDGKVDVLVSGLPSMGDHHTNGPAVGPDGRIYFGVGTATNSGVVGEDNAQFGWLKRRPEFHDVPCKDVKVTGHAFASANPLSPGSDVHTGAFVAFGQTTKPGEVIKGRVPCSGAILRMPTGGGEPELVAWGFRNPFGLAFDLQGQLYVTENGYDERGSRPVWGTADVLWKIMPGTWYGWPDFSAGEPLTKSDYHPKGRTVEFLLAEHPNAPPKPAAILGVHSSSNGLDFAPSSFGYAGQAFIAQFGDQAPTVGKVLSPVGFKVVRVDVASGVVHDFAVNRGDVNAPASKLGSGGLERPVSVRFDPQGTSLYVVDFGVLLQSENGAMPQKETGVLWRVRKGGGP